MKYRKRLFIFTGCVSILLAAIVSGCTVVNTPIRSEAFNLKTEDNQAAEPVTHSAYSSINLTLMGLALHHTSQMVTEMYGSPNNEFMMDDEDQTITVYDYEAFSVGFGEDDGIIFIDVASGNVDPGLKGLRLGQKANDAVEALGNPDTNTNFVMTYNTERTILKLDIDPQTNVVRSIKLFSTELP